MAMFGNGSGIAIITATAIPRVTALPLRQSEAVHVFFAAALGATPPYGLRSAYRAWGMPDSRLDVNGFRIARKLTA